MIFGSLPAGDQTTRAALVDMLRRTHAYFGARPEVRKVLVAPDGSLAMAFFAAPTGSGPVWGLVIGAVSPGQAARGALIFDLPQRLPQTLRPMLVHLAAEVPATPGALPLTRQTFPDNSGSIGVPAGWTLQSAGQGKFLIRGPNREIVLGGGQFTAYVPGSYLAQSSLQLLAAGYPRIKGVYIAPYSPDPVRATLNLGAAVTALHHKPTPRILKIIADRVLGRFAGSTVAYVEVVDDLGAGRPPVHFSGLLWLTPPAPQGEWSVFYVLAARAAESEVKAIRPTMLAMVRSLRLNKQVLDAERRDQQRWFDSFEKTMQRREDAQAASSAAFDRVIRGVDVIANTATGRHYEGPSDIASALINARPGTYRYVPLDAYIKGVDY